MAVGIAIPIGVTPKGGGKWTSGNANDTKTLQLALSDCDNEHAFQQELGIDIETIFSVKDENARIVVYRAIERIFERFE